MPKVKVSLIDGMRFRGESESGNTVTMDSSPDFGGQNAGMKPMELVLTALGGCTGMDVVSILRKKRLDVTGYELSVTGERAEEYPRVYKKIHVEHIVRGRNIDASAVKRAIELSTDKYCPVIAMLSECADIKTSYRIAEDEPAPAAEPALVGKG